VILMVNMAPAPTDGAAGALPDTKDLAQGKTVTFNSPPNYRACVDDGDAVQLVDGKLSPASPIWFDPSIVGWVGPDPVTFTLDLSEAQPIRGVALHKGAGRAGVEWPAAVGIYTSDDGERYSFVGDLMQMLVTQPPDGGYAAIWLATDRLQTHGRYVRFVCTPVNLGNGDYIMLDEVQVYRGETEWLEQPLVFPEAPEHWSAGWGAIEWRGSVAAISPSARPRHITLIDGDRITGSEGPLQQVVVTGSSISFTFRGEAGRARRMFWTALLPEPISTENCRYARMSFRAEGLRRSYDVRPLVQLQGLNEKTSGSAVTLLEINMPPNDARTHTLIKPLPVGFVLQQLKVDMISESDVPRLTIERLELLSEVRDTFCAQIRTGLAREQEGLVPVDLEPVLNDTLSGWYDRVIDKHGIAFDGAQTLPPGLVEVSGIPFAIAAREKNLAQMPETPRFNRRVRFLRQEVDSCNIDPQARDDTLSVGVDACACEAFLLLTHDAPPVQRRRVPNTALRLDDIECFSIQLTYDEGRSELAFPYSLTDEACYIPARELGAYAVAVDPTRRLKKVTLHAHQFGMNFGLAALTLNTSDTPRVPELAGFPAPERTTQNPPPRPRAAAIQRDGGRISIGNAGHEYGIDLSEGFVLNRVVNRWNPPAGIELGPTSGLRVRVGETVYTGRCFASEVVAATDTDVRLRLTSIRPELPLRLSVTIAASESPELDFVAEATNTGAEPLSIELCLPAIADLVIGDVADTRLFFPQYRVADTGQNLALRAPYGPEFTTQFMDVYSRPAGIGLMIRTDNREQRMADFALRKDATGVSGGVWFPHAYNEIAPGATRTYPPVSLIAHNGDWHEAVTLYRDWLRSWYAPYKSQDEEYFLNAWDLTCYRPIEELSWREARVPGLVTPDRTEFLVDETFAYEKRYLGHVPDIIHFFNWTYDGKNMRQEQGVYGTPRAYEKIGGLDLLRRGIAEIQDGRDRPVSLYTVNDRFRRSALPDQKLAQELAANARHIQPDDDETARLRGVRPDGTVHVAFGHPGWEEFFIQDIIKMQRDTGCQVVYMDVMPRFSHLRGYQGISPREDDIKVVKRVREGLPDEVALWSEYPFTDVASQYADGCLQYYFLELNETFARPYNRSDRADDLFVQMPINIGRWVIPRYKIFCLPVHTRPDNKPSRVDAAFINGEVFHEDTWHLHYSRVREKLNRAYVVKHEYGDCFGTDDPLPRVQTAALGITANFFPGEGRHAWTLYNGRPKTYSGIVLHIPHREGSTYRDAWNDTPLTPTITDGLAQVSLTIDPQQPGCVVQQWGQ